MSVKSDPPASGPSSNGIVEGDATDNRIDAAYTGDPDGDMIDNGDANLPGEAPDDDIVDAGAGDDFIEAGEGDDEIYAGSGDDEVYGQVGDDIIYGDDTAAGRGAGGGREVFQWDQAPDPDDGGAIDVGDDLSGGFTQNTGTVDVTFNVTQGPGSASTFASHTQLVDGIVTDGAPADVTSSLDSDAYVENQPVTYDLGFSEPVENVSFRINDIDNDGLVTVKAFDINGDPIEINMTGGSDLTLSDTDAVPGVDTADSNGGNEPYTTESYSVLVNIPGPVASLTIIHDQDGPLDSGIAVTDIYFDAPAYDPGIGGDDSLHGGAGDDIIYGGDGDDLITGGDGSDTVDGGDGDDIIDTSSTSGIPLPDRGFPSYEGLPAVPADSDPYDDRDTVHGGDGNDTITTGDDNDVIYGGAGDDIIDGGLDDDTIDGGSGDDVIVGGEGSDEIHGGEGDDTIYGGLDPIFPDGLNIRDDGSVGDPDPDPTNGMDVIYGGAGDDTIYGQDDDDTLFGGAGDDVLDGGIDDDYIEGGAGNDTIIGGQGDDTLIGGDDRDTFIGGDGNDTVDGGSGGDDYDTLDLTGTNFTITSQTLDPDGNSTSGTIDFFDGTGAPTGTMNFAEIENIIPCFTPGTRIATPQGERLVEDLEIGDRVITRDNGIQEIRWVGSRRLNGLELSLADHLQPVMIRKGALGKGLPERDMMVSPQHRVLLANDRTALYFEDREVLVAAKHLVGMEGVERIEQSSVTYIHFMFDQHEVVLSDGAWTESFQPGDLTLNGMQGTQRDEILALFPELRTQQGLAGYQAARRSLKKHEAALLMQ
ncbi:Hint domain-containing protein [Antarcticimicrobium sediminis]|uniref:Type I secretion protein n=1 Tax=Antarcticimicrobium sediminis TaxID=2546227 RepID=A0A4R5EU47_9RHOB|nr:Hint domain-containing protein [Antarcticimicrobium sediminis]TDE38431.1 type I secretion protein [Antarcticimicrobium sediminis]